MAPSPIKRLMVPADASEQSSAAYVDRAWYVACAAADLRAKPLPFVLLGAPLVLFRDGEGRPGALLDRCPHRNVPLSLGRVAEGELECGYHGWRFDRGGRCLKVPGLCGAQEASARNAAAFPCVEQDGWIWVWASREHEPEGDPFRFPLTDDPRYLIERQSLSAEATLHATAENALDVPHTAFLHAGLFRKEGERQPIEVVVRRWGDRVEAEYIGESRPKGLVGRLLAPQGGVVEHFDRFILPSILQVEYRLGNNHLLVTAALTPEEDFRTRLHAAVAIRSPLPGSLVAPVIRPLALRIFGQDATLLKLQTEAIRRFGGERFVSTEIDVLGPHIRSLLQHAERGKAPAAGGEPKVKRLTMMV